MSDNGYRGHIYTRLIQAHVPEHLHDGLMEYLCARRPVGSFLTAVLANDLRDACCRAADHATVVSLPDIVRFLVNYAHPASWGSREAVEQWLAGTSPVPEIFE